MTHTVRTKHMFGRLLVKCTHMLCIELDTSEDRRESYIVPCTDNAFWEGTKIPEGSRLSCIVTDTSEPNFITINPFFE